MFGQVGRGDSGAVSRPSRGAGEQRFQYPAKDAVSEVSCRPERRQGRKLLFRTAGTPTPQHAG